MSKSIDSKTLNKKILVNWIQWQIRNFIRYDEVKVLKVTKVVYYPIINVIHQINI